MSWSCYKMGSKDKVRAACIEELDKAAASYAGQEEALDVVAAKERVLSAIDSLTLTADAYATEGYGVSVSASGHRSTYETNLKVEVKRVQLLV